MRLQTREYETKLNNAAVDGISAKIKSFCESQKAEYRDIIRYSLTAEEILLDELERLGEGSTVRLETGRRLFRSYFSLETEGSAYNVFSADLEENGALGESILKNLGLSPEYSYKKGKNVYSFRFKKKSMNPLVLLVIALAAALLTGAAGLLLPENIRTVLLDSVLTPLHDTFLNILGCIAGPMVFLSVTWGIYGIGDAATLKKVGKKILSYYILIVFTASVVAALVCVPFFRLGFASGADSSGGVSAVFSMLLNIVPKNIVSPFMEGNTLQIIFLAVVAGMTMLILGKKTSQLAAAVEQLNNIFQYIIEFISKVIPAFIYIVLVSMIWSDSASSLFSVGKLVIVFLIGVLALQALLIGIASVRNRTSPLTLIKKGLPAFLVAVSTASSAATFGTNLKSCKNSYGIDENITSFGLPLGMVTFKPNSALHFTVISVFFAEVYGVEVSPAWIVMLLFSASVLAMSAPPIPGGALTVFTVLFTQLGIPPEALAIALATDAVFDFIDTGMDQFELPLALLTQANKLGKVDREVLKRR